MRTPDVFAETQETTAWDDVERLLGGPVDPEATAADLLDDLRDSGLRVVEDTDTREIDRIDEVLSILRAEMLFAVGKFPRFASPHEGWAIIREEVDELWDEIKGDKRDGARARMRKEALQVAAMGARFLLDIPEEN